MPYTRLSRLLAISGRITTVYNTVLAMVDTGYLQLSYSGTNRVADELRLEFVEYWRNHFVWQYDNICAETNYADLSSSTGEF